MDKFSLPLILILKPFHLIHMVNWEIEPQSTNLV